MAKTLGRKMIFKRNGTPIANLRSKSLSINNELVDTTDSDSSGWAERLAEPGQKEVVLSVSGVLANDTLRAEAISTSLLQADTIEFADGATLTGNFVLGNYSEGHEYNEVATFDAEVQSSGEITYTAAA